MIAPGWMVIFALVAIAAAIMAWRSEEDRIPCAVLAVLSIAVVIVQGTM